MNLEVLGHRVLIDPEFESATTEWGFDISAGNKTWEREQEATQVGKIVSIGPNAWLDFKPGTAWAKVGDVVYYSRYAHKTVMDGQKKYFIVNDEDIQCKIVKPTKEFED